jgi:putative aldouronate transport system permease protein
MNKKSTDYIFQTINYFVFSVFSILCIYPFVYILFYSLSDSNKVITETVYLKPAGFTLQHYFDVFKIHGIGQAFMVSTARTVIGTALSIFLCAMFAYILTKNALPFRKFIYRILVFTMYVTSGLIPWYITMITLGLRNNFLLYILPGAIAPFSIILIKTYVESLPQALEESAHIDGANVFVIFIRIIIPLSLPVLAAVCVFTAVGQWNSWTDNFFLVNKTNLKTVQLILREFLTEAESLAQAMSSGNRVNVTQVRISPMTIRMTTTIIVTLPILFVYPLLQKYFIKGIMLGAVKG